MPAEPLIVNTDCGLYCPRADVHIDAWRPVDRTIVTHAHSDHARYGSKRYLTADEGVALLRQRLGEQIQVDPIPFGQSIDINCVKISLHPAGHVRGSSQVRLESRGEVVVFSGDYKRHPDPTTKPFEPLRCHTFITECTFGLPIYRWPDPKDVVEEINAWWRENQQIGRTCILLAYSLGKAQRVLASIDPTIGPILLHGAVHAMVQAYERSGLPMPPTHYATAENAKLHKGRALVIAPPSAMNSPWSRKFAPFSAGSASGWMHVRGFRRRRGVDRGFVLSDHVDWPALMQTIAETGATRVIATHGQTATLVRFLREQGIESEEFCTRFKNEGDDDEEATADATTATVPGEGTDGESAH